MGERGSVSRGQEDMGTFFTFKVEGHPGFWWRTIMPRQSRRENGYELLSE